MTAQEYRERCQALGKQISGHYVGPVPPQDFFEKFMPLPKGRTVPNFIGIGFGDMERELRGDRLCKPFVSLATSCFATVSV